MAETFLFSIAGQILEKLGSVTLQQIGVAVGVKRELKKLEETISTIKAVLLDAEEKQSKNRQLTLWLERLKDACYDADDLLDKFAYEALRQLVIARGSFKTKVSSLFSHSEIKFRFVMGRKIKNIIERLDEIANNRTQFHLTERELVEWEVPKMEREMTHSFLHPSEVIGRDSDRKKIVEILTCKNLDRNFTVVPIVGIAGLGKTTVAKLVYNDESVKDYFELRMWVCVSDNFNLKRLTKEIIISATNDDCRDLSIDQLQARLRETLHGKKYMLVFDDVWNHDLKKWNELKQLLLDGAHGSKVVVTTRFRSVASIMGTVDPYILEGLPNMDSWALFVKCAFKEGDDEKNPNLELIGKQIIRKCRGVPLALRSLGSMLYTKTDEQDWLSIKENETWRLKHGENDILPALELSYKELPSYLKQCFAYCSIFPKDYLFKDYTLVQMWIAQNFIHSSDEHEELEDIGKRYIRELLSRCFFQDMEKLGSILYFKMHDLVHDLASSVSQSECFAIKHLPAYLPIHDKISNTVRHVSFCDRNLSTHKVPEFLLKLANLRTILFPIYGVGVSSKSLVETCTTRFKYLRMLDLSNSTFAVLPKSVGSLKHLRHLTLSKNVTIKKLPNSISRLLQLQDLSLYGCMELKKLPNNIGNLISLRRLSVAAKHMCLQSSEGIGSLISLKFLWIDRCPILITAGEGIKSLTSLKTLAFTNCENLKSLPGSIKRLSALETLSIGSCEKLNLMEWDDDTHNLSLINLKSIFFRQLPQLKTLPGWLQGVSNTLQYLSIAECSNLTALPEWIQNLIMLRKLEIWSCPELSAMPEGMHRLTSLRELVIKWCPLLRQRCEEEDGEDWHKISHIPNITIDRIKIKSSLC